MKIRQINKSINEIITGASYLGNGASKEAYLKDGVVYKVPRGRYLIENTEVAMAFPNTVEEIDEFLAKIEEVIPQMVWPLGQFATELVVWEAIQDLRKKGLDINCFAEIKDYYFDKNGVIVIEQEVTEPYPDGEDTGLLFEEMEKEIDMLRPVLKEEYNVMLRDIRSGNCGVSDGRMKLFDFGLSTTTNLDSYDDYSCYEDDWCDSYNSYEGY